MIRQAVESDFAVTLPNDECALRIHSLRRAYGLNVPFIRYYTDECGGLLTVMDGAGILYCTENMEEWTIFITMNPEIVHLHCSASIGRILTNMGVWQGRGGVVLKYEGNRTFPTPDVCENRHDFGWRYRGQHGYDGCRNRFCSFAGTSGYT